MALSTNGKNLVCTILIAAACASPRSGVHRAALDANAHPTFMHVGFGTGPVVFTDDTGHLVEERRYEPFGAPVDAHQHGGGSDTIGAPDLVARDLNPLNKRSDAATGWSDHGARWLAPETGRWLTPDPAVAGPDAKFMAVPWGLHPYQYADQNPVVYWDPDGRSPAVAAVAQDAPAVPPIVVGALRFGAAIGGAFVRGFPIVGLIAAPVASVVQHAQHPEDFPLECDGCEIIKLELELQQDAQAAAADRAKAVEEADAVLRDSRQLESEATLGLGHRRSEPWLRAHGATNVITRDGTGVRFPTTGSRFDAWSTSVKKEITAADFVIVQIGDPDFTQRVLLPDLAKFISDIGKPVQYWKNDEPGWRYEDGAFYGPNGDKLEDAPTPRRGPKDRGNRY